MQVRFKPWLLRMGGLLSVSFFATYLQAQQPLKLVNSGEVIQEGIKLHDKGAYKKAIELYRQVPEGDTNYNVALNEQLVSLLADSSFGEAKRIALKALARPAISYRRDFMLYLGHAYDYMGQRDSAMLCYDSLIRMNRYDHQPLYEKGVVYFHEKKYDQANEYFQRALMLNPYHFRSHYIMGTSLALQGRFAEAYMALSTSLFTTNDAGLAKSTLYIMGNIARQTDELTAAYRNRKKEAISPAYEEIDAIINSKLPMSKGYSFKSELSGNTMINTLHAVMEKLQFDAGDENFAMQYYGPIFTAVYKNGAFDPFTIMMLSGYEIEAVEKLAKKNKADVKDMQEYIFSYLDRIAATQTLNVAQRKKAAEEFAIVPQKNLFIIGAVKSKDPLTFKAGPVTMYKNGVLASKGTYDAAGEEDGEWKYYHGNGNLSALRHYKNGTNTGKATFYYSNGNLREEYVFDNAGKELQHKEYDYSGYLESASVTNGERKTITLYHPNGTKNFEGVTNGDRVEDGIYKYYNRSGAVSKEVGSVKGKRDGTYKEYYDDGKLYEESHYTAGKREGSYNTYYRNGKTHYRATYLGDKPEGMYEIFNAKGTLTERGNYRYGKKNGTDSLFSPAGTFYGFVKYKSDMPVGYYFIDEDGKVAGQDQDEHGIRKLMLYHPNGNLQAEINYKNGVEQGPAKYYYAGGSIRRSTNFKNGSQDGQGIDYYKNGIVKSEVNYTDGTQDGLYRFNYASGILNYEGWMKGGQKQGIWRYYNPAGKLTTQRHFVNDKLNGPTYAFLSNGKPNYTDVYDHDMLVEMLQYDSTGKETAHKFFPGGNGLYELKYPNGKPCFSCRLKNGEYDGAFTNYLPNGTVIHKGFFNYGLRDSIYESYSKSGVLIARVPYKNNNQHGTASYYDEEGNLWKEINYVAGERSGTEKVWEKGLLRYEHQFLEGNRDGMQKIYGEAGKTACVLYYTNDNLTGYAYEGKDGQLRPVTPVKNGTCKITAYYPNEKTSAELEFKDGVYNGRQLIYYSNGQKAEERNFDKSDLNGPLKKWAPAGTLTYEAVYRNDEYNGTETEYDSKGAALSVIDHLEGGIPHGTAIYTHPKTRKKLTVYYYYGQIIDAR